jgi:hypothetical protein
MNNSCKKEWTRKFIVENFPKSFITNEWKKNREQVLYDKEKALLPATQVVVEERKEKEKIRHKIMEINQMIYSLNMQKRNLEIEYNNGGPVLSSNYSRSRHFIRACPDEDCRGYLSSQWKCGLCDKWTCPDCHVVIGIDKHAEHVCNEDNIQTVKLLENDTKPCPKCQTGIFKIDGCDQMWCTQCHTAFSWRTGRIETRVHNPHYFEFMRRGGNGQMNLDDPRIVCGREINDAMISTIIKSVKDHSLQTSVECIVQSISHLHHVQYPAYDVDQNENNLELRVQFLQNKISEQEFKVRVQRANKQQEKKRETGEIIHLFHRTVTEIIIRMYQYTLLRNTGSCTENKYQSFIHEIYGIQEYANECLNDISNTYGSKLKKILLYNTTRGRAISHNPVNGRTKYSRDVITSDFTQVHVVR